LQNKFASQSKQIIHYYKVIMCIAHRLLIKMDSTSSDVILLTVRVCL